MCLLWQISLSVTEELHIICFNTVFQHKGLDIALQVCIEPFPERKSHDFHVSLFGSVSGGFFRTCLSCDKCRPPPSQWSSSLIPASSRVPGRPSFGSTWSAWTPRQETATANRLEFFSPAALNHYCVCADTPLFFTGHPVLCQLSCSVLAAVWRDAQLAVSLCH